VKLLPVTIGLTLELAYLPLTTTENHSCRHGVDLNQFVDSVLRTIYHTSASLNGLYARRKLVFTSFCPEICVALNWKQPNCELIFQYLEDLSYDVADPVFFASRCGKRGDRSPTPTALTIEDKNDRRLHSLSSAVELAQINNLLGVFIDAGFLVSLPFFVSDCHSPTST